MSVPEVAAVPVTGSLADLLRSATDREPLLDNAGKSGAYIERVTLDGVRYVVKYLDLSQDWTMRAAGVLRGATLELWTRGLLDALPDCFDQPIVAVAVGQRNGDAGGSNVTALVMRDVAAMLVDSDGTVISAATHEQFLRHLAALHARFWEAGPEIDIVPAMTRYLELSPWTAIVEEELGSEHLVPRLIGRGWPLLAEVAPDAARIVVPLAWDPGPLVAALESTPQTLVHGNFKLDNLGVTPEGRTVVLDWEGSGRGSATGDLAWYLAINCRRLPQSKEESILNYRRALEDHGIPTEEWWDRQLALSLLGGLVHFGWEKALGGMDDELAWWQDKAILAQKFLPT
jgi:hypothetical protein